MSRPTRILLSFTSTVLRLGRKELLWPDLDSSLWFFGCSRNHALNPNENRTVNEWYWIYGQAGLDGRYATPAQREEVQTHMEAFRLHLLLAETEGRCVWHSDLRDGMRDDETWGALTNLIARWYPEAHGLAMLSGTVSSPSSNGYSYPAAATYVSQFGISCIPEQLNCDNKKEPT